jgi:mitochondrial cardiolipin hydrolase
MPSDPIHEHLLKSLDDRSFSRGETKVLRALLADLGDGVEQRRKVSEQAFVLARELANRGEAERAAAWLETIVDVLLGAVQPTSAPSAKSGIAEVFFSPGEGCRKRIVDLFGQARQSADVCVFTITDDRITDSILAAHLRGTKVRVVSDNEKAFDPGSDLDRLRDAGVPVAVDTSPHHMHHKFALFDSRLVLSGSYNWTRSAADMNEENVLVSDDPRVVAAFRGEFDRLWKRFGSEA